MHYRLKKVWIFSYFSSRYILLFSYYSSIFKFEVLYYKFSLFFSDV